MLIPSIDLQAGRIVQLVQGERLAVETDDIQMWIDRFRDFRAVHVIDLDAAKGAGSNDAIVTRICAELPSRVGGGIRSVERAREVLDAGATHVIVSSALFAGDRVDVAFAETLALAIGAERVIAAVDSRGGRVVIHGWRTPLEITPERAIQALEPFVGGVLYTHVDREGLMRGTDLDAIKRVRAATSRPFTAAGGISGWDEVEELEAAGIDAVVGMAIYTGRMNPAGIRPV